LKDYKDINFSALVPNYKGAEIASRLELNNIAYVVSLSESHNKANINKTHEDSLNEYLRIKEDFPDLNVSLDLSTTFGCPFEDKKNNPKITYFLKSYIENGVKEIYLYDTIGVANPKEVQNVIKDMKG